MIDMMRVQAYGLSDIGRVRNRNEDSFGIDEEQTFYVVADGMGGHGNGEIASQIAVEAFRGHLTGAIDEGGTIASTDMLREAIQYAHQRVLNAVAEDGSLVGMGTTIVTVFVNGGKIAIGHVGDSRVYRFRGGSLELLTEDHTWVNQQVAAGYMSEEQARVHPLKNVVTRALGGESDVDVELSEIDARVGDRFLLCSDGLSAMLDDSEIQARLQENGELDALCQSLVATANQRGGVDNVTVLLVEIQT